MSGSANGNGEDPQLEFGRQETVNREKTMIDSERLDLESASSAYRRRRCTGSVNLVRTLRQAGKLQAPLPDPNAKSGTDVHHAWCIGSDGDLSPMQRDTLASLARMEALLVTDWAGNDEYTLLGREVRLWLHSGLEPIHSGQYDAMYGTISSGRMLILDGKTLFGEVTPAESNDQLRELVALAYFNYPAAREFTVAILQPWVSQRPSVAVYDSAQAQLSLHLLRLAIEDAADPDAPRTPGGWCAKCPAIGQCEEARTLATHTSGVAKAIQEGFYVLPLGERGATLLDAIAAAEPILRAVRERYKELLVATPEAVPGWYMKEGRKVREITNVPKAYEIASDYIALDQFLAATTLKIGALTEAIGLATQLKGKTLEERFAETFSGVITMKQFAPELTRESERKGRHKELQ